MWPRAMNATRARLELLGMATALIVLCAHNPSAAGSDLILAFGNSVLTLEESVAAKLQPRIRPPSEEQSPHPIEYGGGAWFDLPGYESDTDCRTYVRVGAEHLSLGPRSENAFWGEVVDAPQSPTGFNDVLELLPNRRDPLRRYYLIDNASLRDSNNDYFFFYTNDNKTDLQFQLSADISVVVLLRPKECLLGQMEDIARRVQAFFIDRLDR